MSSIDSDGKVINWAAAFAGGLIGAGFEYANQAIDNFQKSNEPNLLNKIIDSGTKNINKEKIGISAGTGFLSGLTLGASTLLGVSANAGLNLAEDYSKKALIDKKEFTLSDVGKSLLSTGLGEIGNGIVKNINLKSSEGKILQNDLDRAERIFNKNQTNGNRIAVEKANIKVNQLGDIPGTIVGGAVKTSTGMLLEIDHGE